MVELLSSAHARCFFAFESLIRALKQPANDFHDQISPTDIHNEFDKYKIWAGNVGAAHSGTRYEISLDYRLREASFLREHVLKLLSNLETRMFTVTALINGERRLVEEATEDSDSDTSTSSSLEVDQQKEGKEAEDSSWQISSASSDENGSSSYDRQTVETSDATQAPRGALPKSTASRGLIIDCRPMSEMSRLVESIKFTIACLYRLPIRRPAPLDRIKHRTSINSSGYQHFDVLYVQDKFPDIQPQAAMRLGKMITRRRQILYYREAHKRNLDVARVEPKAVIIPGALSSSFGVEDELTVAVQAHREQATPSHPASSQAASSHFTAHSKATTARPGQVTFLASQEHMDTLSAPSVADSNLSVASSYAGKHLRVDVPSRPKNDNGEELESFECPYCLLTKYISNERKWKRHVLEDLQPYVCTYGDCELYDHFFENRDTWFQHEAQNHRAKWSCNSENHPEYDSEADFLSHMWTDHNRKFDEAQFNLLKSVFRRPTKSLEGMCNLCNRRSKNLKSHVSRHLQQIATFALPRVNETKGSGQAERKSKSSRYRKDALDNDETSGSYSSHSSAMLSDDSNFNTSDIADDTVEEERIPDAVEDQDWNSVTDKFLKARKRTFRQLQVLIYGLNDSVQDKVVSLIKSLNNRPTVISGRLNNAADVVLNYGTPDAIIIGESPSTARRIRAVTDTPIILMRDSQSYTSPLSDMSNWIELVEPSQGDIEEALGSLCHWAPAPPLWRSEPPKIKLTIKRPRTSEQRYLVDTISRSFVTSTFDTQERLYLPESCIKGRLATPAIDGLVTIASVEKEFVRATMYNEYPVEALETVVTWIVNNASRIFTISVQCHLQPDYLLSAMLNFYNVGFSDAYLPIDDPRASDPNAPRAPRADAFNADIWEDSRYYQFFEIQWRCLAPVFTLDRYEYNLPSQCILPFKKALDTDPRGGVFTSVFKVIVHPDHQQRHPSLEVAIKQIAFTKGLGSDRQEADRAWDIEARALNAINSLGHPHIIESIAAIRRGESRYFMFPWAENSLRDYWNTIPRQSPNSELVSEAINQLRGIADALDQVHNFQGGRTQSNDTYRDMKIVVDSAANTALQMNDDEDVNDYRNPMSQESIRHGDLRPENILRFLDGKSRIGTLKLGDMDLAKRHIAATDQRRSTSIRYGSRRYGGPETMGAIEGRSRLYDIWSMGCITFEFIVWLLYGNEALVEFFNQADILSSPSEFQYYKLQGTGGAGLRHIVNPLVTSWMDHMQKHDPEIRQDSKSALKDLLQIVQDRLLVVDLPPTRGSAFAARSGGRVLSPPFVGGKAKYRATAAEFRKALDAIKEKEGDPNYVCTGQDRSDVSLPAPPRTYGSFLDPLAQHRSGSSRRADIKIEPLSTGVMQRTIRADYSLPPLESWEFEVDNGFATKAIKHLRVEDFPGPTTIHNKLCGRCAKLNFWSSGFVIEDDADDLAKSATTCDFCALLQVASSGTDRPRSEKIRFERIQSVIAITGNTFPVLSIVRSPELVTPTNVQIGRPDLPDLEKLSQKAFFDLAEEWLRDCDEGHVGCQVQLTHKLPTRLIDVGTLQAPVLRLVETQHEVVHSTRYIALSHIWGDTKAYKAFVTLRKDESNAGHDLATFKSSIPYDELPKTFKHAVDCTRNLNIRYLWIDAICIIQGTNGDFSEEAKRMEDVYSGAYCVVAASRARDQRDGFLGARPQRQYVTFHPEKPFYVCRTIDHFNEDVIMGPLNQQGWALPQRALARRTMYFTEKQTYFECGNGVRCETLTKMRNNMADFLGDPNFPSKAMRASRALRIAYFQGLYAQYSRMSFTRWEDRPVAIAGLERRIQQAFNTKGRYGIFDDGDKADGGLFHRSLLWRRGNQPLEAINFTAASQIRVPSWSWMAYKGAIDYTDSPYQSAQWETRGLIPPWTRGGYRDPDANEEVSITAVARNFNLKGRNSEDVSIAYDTERSTEGQRAQCVVLARSNGAQSDQESRYYVLLVIPTQIKTDDGWVKYKRVGAGYMLGKYIALDTDATEIRIF